MRVTSDTKIDFEDVLISPKRSYIDSRSDVNLERAYGLLHQNGDKSRLKGTGVCAANMHTTGSFEMANAMAQMQMFCALSKHYKIEEYVEFYNSNTPAFAFAFYTVGMSQSDRDKFSRVYEQSDFKPMMLCIDIANGYSQKFLKEVGYYRETYPNLVILAGNVATAEMTEALLLGGADIVKIGIGSGANCLTRRVTGVGYPQLSAVSECADAAHGLGGLIMSDGGCKQIGDVCKALCAGADFVMLGGMLAAHDECNGLIEHQGVKMYEHYGMSSDKAMKDHNIGKKPYRASEGRETLLFPRGPIEATLQEICGGIRSCASYIGAKNIKDMPKCASFVRCHAHSQLNQSLSEFTVS